MTFWIIEPRDPLIVRDGRPFGPNPGARATTLPFPFPSTIVGALRSKAGLNTQGQFAINQIPTVLTMGLRGPLLVELDDNDTVKWLLPAPADALVLETTQTGNDDTHPAAQRFRMHPLEKEAITNMPAELLPIGPAMPHPEKVSGDAPYFWYGNELYQWLLAPTDDSQPVLIEKLGIRGLEIDTRMHVSIEAAQQTAREGALFQTSGLEFTWSDPKQLKKHTFVTKRLALATWFDGDTPHFNDSFAPLGGERRLMRWDKSQTNQEPFSDEQRNNIFVQIKQDRRCRVVLLTPAYFASKRDNGSEIIDGYRPPLTWTRGGVSATLKAAVVPRSQTISGWDMAANNGRGAPKPTRRLAPAGNVYFVEFAEDADIDAWLKATWMCNVSDDMPNPVSPMTSDQYRLDGFGLAVLGTWNNTAITEIK